MRLIGVKDFEQLVADVRASMNNRDMIAVAARLIAIMRHAFEQPWAYPALLETKEIIELRKAFVQVVDITKIPANVTSTTPAALATARLTLVASFAIGHASYMASLTNQNYGFTNS